MSRKRTSDPDPLVIDLLVNVAATAIVGAAAKLGKIVFARGRLLAPHDLAAETQLRQLREEVGRLEGLLGEATQLVSPRIKREAGAQLLLTRQALSRYDSLREQLFKQIRAMDELVRRLPVSDQAEAQRRPPPEIATQLKFIEKRLRDARVAALSEHAFLDMRSAVIAIDQMVATLEERSLGGA